MRSKINANKLTVSRNYNLDNLRNEKLLADYYDNAGKALIKILNVTEDFATNFSAMDIGFHPITQKIYAEIFNIESEENRQYIKFLIFKIKERLQLDLEMRSKGNILLIQDEALLPKTETRSIGLTPVPNYNDKNCVDFGIRLKKIREMLGEPWIKHTKILFSYTAVLLDAKRSPSLFSGTNSDAFGAAHGAEIDNDEQMVEILVHESAHLWLMIIEKYNPDFIQNNYNDSVYISPWRKDLRPIRGIYHGLYSFFFTCHFLIALNTDTALSRAEKIITQLDSAILVLDKYGIFSNLADKIFNQIKIEVLKMKYQINV